MGGRIPERPQLRWTATRAQGRTVLAIAGEVDLGTAPELDAALREQLARGPVLLDLGELEFIGSTGMHVLDALVRDGAEQGWQLAVRPALRSNVRRVLELTGMLAVLPFEDG